MAPWKFVPSYRWIVAGVLISVVEVMTLNLPFEGDPPPGMGESREFIGDVCGIIFLFTAFPISVPKLYVLEIARRLLNIPVYSDQPGFSDALRVVFDFAGDLLVCYVYYLLFQAFRWLWNNSVGRIWVWLEDELGSRFS